MYAEESLLLLALLLALLRTLWRLSYQAGRPDLIRSPRLVLVLAHVWEGVEL
jgi:hypothetical protein